MKKIYAKEINYAPAVGDFELYLASDVDARIDQLENWLQDEMRESQFPDFDDGHGYVTALERVRDKLRSLMVR